MTSRDALSAEISKLSPALRSRLEHHGFDRDRLLDLAATLGSSGATGDGTDRNRVRGEVTPPKPGEILEAPAGDDEAECRRRGEEALRRGEVAMCVLAGGMATR